MNNIKIVEVKKLFIKKNFEETINFIENIFTDTEKTPEIFNILGVSKLQKKTLITLICFPQLRTLELAT